jgi:hypothetical protein
VRLVTVDAETHWTADYSLSKMSPLEYVRDDRFELISMGIKVDNQPAEVYFGEADIRRALKQIDWNDAFLIGHNMSGFDAYIFAYRLGIRPRVWGCTLAMARPIHASTTGLSLAALVEHYGIGRKDGAILLQTRGKRLADFTRDELALMRTYNRDDVEQCYALFHRLRPHYSPSELWQIDAVIRMRTEPRFVLNETLLEQTLADVRDQRRKALIDLAEKLGIGTELADEDEIAESVRAELASTPKFCALLERCGVAVPMKPSPKNPESMIPALAKTDQEFLALQDHENPIVAAAVRARLDVKSTLLETRIEKFLTAARLAGGRLPIPLRYCGADTTGRDSGEEYNPQNLPRIAPGKPKPSDALRLSLGAPAGHKIIVADQSGIELRVNHFLWQVPYSTELYRQDPVADLYRASAAIRRGCRPEDITKEQRQASKIENLGLGFGMGWQKFKHTALVQGGMRLTDEQAIEAVEGWRALHKEIVNGWKACDRALSSIVRGVSEYIDPGNLTYTCSEGIVLPSGRLIRYPDLRYLDEDGVISEFYDGQIPEGSYEKKVMPLVGWWYGRGKNRARIYGGKVDENIVQALARDSIFDCAVEFYRRTAGMKDIGGLRPSLRVHDELIYVVPEQHAQKLLELLQHIMRTPPKWWPDLVVWSEGGVADCYGEAK